MHIHLSGADFVKIEQLFDTMAECGVTHTAIQALPYRSVSQNLVALYWKYTYKKMDMKAFGGIHITDRYRDVPCEVQAGRMLDMGFDGIKLIDMCPDIRHAIKRGIDSADYDRMLSLCEERGTPMVIHVADPISFWEKPNGPYSVPTFMSKREHYEETFRMLDRHPKLNVAFAHFFFLSGDCDEAVRVMETYPNVYFDLTPNPSMYVDFSKDIEYWHDFFVRYSTRIMFGTDSGPKKNFNAELNSLVYTALTREGEFNLPCYGRQLVKGLYLEGEPLDNILYNNYERFTAKGGEVPAVTAQTIIDGCERVLQDMSDGDHSVFRSFFDELTMLRDDPDEAVATNFFAEAIRRLNG